ncbi:MAG: hypothetical protein MJ180_05300 [Candidatus Gastranaerophilales bacterium]|nr:hypothetical protein [Candidatus Gastranaerophilales bacterium]
MKKYFIIILISFLVIAYFLFVNQKSQTSYAVSPNKTNKCKLSEKIDNFHSYKHIKYDYDNWGNTIEYETPYKNIIDKATSKTLYAILAPIADSFPYYAMRIIDNKGKEIWSSTCKKSNWEDCKQAKPKYQAYTDKNGNTIKMYSDNKMIYRKEVYDKNNNLLEYYNHCYSDLTKCYDIYKYTYNKNKTIATEYHSYNTGYYHDYYKYFYNSNNTLNEKYKCNNNFENCSLVEKYIYYPNTKTISELYKKETGWFKNKYNTKGNLTALYSCEKNKYNFCTNLLFKYYYDSKNNQTASCQNCDNKTGICKYCDKYEYDINNNKISESTCRNVLNDCTKNVVYKYVCE